MIKYFKQTDNNYVVSSIGKLDCKELEELSNYELKDIMYLTHTISNAKYISFKTDEDFIFFKLKYEKLLKVRLSFKIHNEQVFFYYTE